MNLLKSTIFAVIFVLNANVFASTVTCTADLSTFTSDAPENYFISINKYTKYIIETSKNESAEEAELGCEYGIYEERLKLYGVQQNGVKVDLTPCEIDTYSVNAERSKIIFYNDHDSVEETVDFKNGMLYSNWDYKESVKISCN